MDLPSGGPCRDKRCWLEFSQEAAADIDLLSRADRRLLVRIINKIESLQENPRAGKPLVGERKFRVRTAVWPASVFQRRRN
jgi:mRNA-degrading endonuclease RelE of RelBE toxin-antitoxin system